jgi:hypothetical protein
MKEEIIVVSLESLQTNRIANNINKLVIHEEYLETLLLNLDRDVYVSLLNGIAISKS